MVRRRSWACWDPSSTVTARRIGRISGVDGDMAGVASVWVEVTVAMFGALAGSESDEVLLSRSPGVVIDSSRTANA